MIRKIRGYFFEDIWKIRVPQLSALRGSLVQMIRILVLTFRFFVRNRCMLHAASLTYYTLLSIVPMLALAFGITKGYGFDKVLKARLLEMVKMDDELAVQIFQFAESAIENASGGVVAGVGVVLLAWSAIKLLGGIENAFNGIWGIRQGRSWSRKCCDYLTLLVVFPFLLVIAAGSSRMVLSHLDGWMLGCISGISVRIVNMVSVCSIFVFIYMFVPNAKVRLRTGLISGAVIGAGFMVLQMVYVAIQSRLTSYNAIYGSFAALPIFLIIMNFGWTLIIFGAQLSFAIQNVSSYELEPEYGDAQLCQSRRRSCALEILNLLIWNFQKHTGVQTASEISARLKIPIRTTRSIIFDLYKCGFIAMVQNESAGVGSECCQIAVPPDDITPLTVFRAMDNNGVDLLTLPEDDDKFSGFSDLFWNNPHPDLNRPLGCIPPPAEEL